MKYLFVFLLSITELISFSQVRQDGYRERELIVSTLNEKAGKAYDAGHNAFMEEKYSEAIIFYKIALENDPFFVDAYDNVALAFRRLGQLDSAEHYNLISLNLVPNNVVALNNLAVVYSKKGLYLKSAETYQKIIMIDSSNADGYYGLAQIFLEIKEFTPALVCAQTAYNIWKTSDKLYAGDAMFCIGKAELSLGLKKEAKVSFRKARKLGTRVPDNYIIECKK